MKCVSFQALFLLTIALYASTHALSEAERGHTDSLSKTYDISKAGISRKLTSYAIGNKSFDILASNDLMGFSIIGGTAYSRPSCVSLVNGVSHCIYRGKDGGVFDQIVKGKRSGGLIDMGGSASGDVMCLVTNENTIDCVTANKENRLSNIQYTDEEWQGWKAMESRRVSTIGRTVCARREDNISTCLVQFAKDEVCAFELNSGKVGSIHCLPGYPHGASTVVSTEPDSVYSLHLGYFPGMYHIHWQASSGWDAKWTPVSSSVLYNSAPISVLSLSGIFHVFATDHTSKMVHFYWSSSGGYSQPTIVGNLAITESPECVAIGLYAVRCFAKGMDGMLYKIAYSGSAWNDCINTGVSCEEAPSCVQSQTNEISCFMRLANYSIGQITFTVYAL